MRRVALLPLARHPGLIPFGGVLGGRMGFYDTTRIVVLNDEWVFADFEDGHIGGHGIFQFDVRPGGRIVWKRVTAKLDKAWPPE